ncbi:hypothetical protein KDA_42360 [Dictyobacter alpinus]|uniref:Uncharacterized protein n=1 Tax=Dictyobacter alpinus TaxID=2014873 RepID=A0A402BBS3_9CHLR|nr:hypothetical protein [Dictyobacter alpinus]GCE28752.1 hypothetical protein KDA_42360 [Dictyobacter alpinus]
MNMTVSSAKSVETIDDIAIGGLNRYHCYPQGSSQSDLTPIPLEVELWYPQTGITEWQYSFVRIILLTGDYEQPRRRLELSALTRRYGLSERQIRRKLEAMVRNGHLLMHKCYDCYGRLETFYEFDCTPFLEQIAALVATDQSYRSVTSCPHILEDSTDTVDDISPYTDDTYVPPAVCVDGISVNELRQPVNCVMDKNDNRAISMTEMSMPTMVLSSMTEMSSVADEPTALFPSSNSNSSYNNNYNNNYITSNSNAVSPSDNCGQTQTDIAFFPQSPAEEPVVVESTLQGEELEATAKSERQLIDDLLAASWQLTDEQPGSNILTTMRYISRELGDDAPRSSLTRAHKLYRHLLLLNQQDDEYTMLDPDYYFAEILLAVRERLRGVRFRCKNSRGKPNGMPLFFTELEREVIQLVDRVFVLRGYGDDDSQPGQQSSYQSQQEKLWGRQEVQEPVLNLNDLHAISDQIDQYTFTDQQLVDEKRRLQQPLSAQYEQDLLAGRLSDHEREQILVSVRLGLYYEEIERRERNAAL